MFVSTVFWATSTPFPFIDPPTEEEGVEFDFAGLGGNLTLYETETQTRGWAVYSFGEYLDEDEDEIWDGCETFEISVSRIISENSSNDSGGENFYPLCEKGFERNDIEGMIYLGQVCYNPANKSSPRCNWGNFSFESSKFIGLHQESDPEDTSRLSTILDWFARGLHTGRTFLCGSMLVLSLTAIVNLFLGDKQQTEIVRTVDANKADWRAYSLSGQERGDDGLPKAFTRHSEKKDIFRKPRKGNRRGGVHKTGGLYLGGWTEEDSNEEYKKKVQDRRND